MEDFTYRILTYLRESKMVGSWIKMLITALSMEIPYLQTKSIPDTLTIQSISQKPHHVDHLKPYPIILHSKA